MSRLTLEEYLNERIENVKYYIEFNERKDEKDFFANKELELYQMASKYMKLTDELGCPLEVVFKAIKNGVHIKIDDEEIDIESWKLSIYLKEQCFIINEMLFKTKLPFSDYGKTWWLKGDKQ